MLGNCDHDLKKSEREREIVVDRRRRRKGVEKIGRYTSRVTAVV